jgi:hypothetical protein
VIYERGHLTTGEIFHLGLWMTLAACLIILFVAIPYWSVVGESLRILPR